MVARETISAALTLEAAAFVDAQVAPVAHKIRPAQLARLVEEAIARYMPEKAAQRRREAADGRHFTIDHQQVSFAGTSLVTGELDLADALDLDDAVRGIAAQLADLGSEDSLDVRRSVAVGELARRQLALDLTTEDPPAGEEPGGKRKWRRPVRKTVLYVHLSQAAVGGHGESAAGVGRVENTRSPITVEQVRAWCGHPETHLVVKPVIDLADHVHVEAYEVADRIAEAVALRDLTCVFPWCTRPARKLRPDEHPCDCDHIVPYRDDGSGGKQHQTCTCQIAPLCRHHHRHKTFSAWTYRVIEPGSYLWTSPHHYQYLRDHTGTLDVNGHRRTCPPGEPPPRD